MAGFRIPKIARRRRSLLSMTHYPKKVKAAAVKAEHRSPAAAKKCPTAANRGSGIEKATPFADIAADDTRSSRSSSSDHETESTGYSESTLSSIHSDSLTSFAGNLSHRVIIPREAMTPPDEVDIVANASMTSSLAASVQESGTTAKEEADRVRLARRGNSNFEMPENEDVSKEHASIKRPATKEAGMEEGQSKTLDKALNSSIMAKERLLSNSPDLIDTFLEGESKDDDDENSIQTVMTHQLTGNKCLFSNLQCIETSFGTSFNIETFRVMHIGDEDANAVGFEVS